jgi:hypothetical protein
MKSLLCGLSLFFLVSCAEMFPHVRVQGQFLEVMVAARVFSEACADWGYLPQAHAERYAYDVGRYLSLSFVVFDEGHAEKSMQSADEEAQARGVTAAGREETCTMISRQMPVIHREVIAGYDRAIAYWNSSNASASTTSTAVTLPDYSFIPQPSGEVTFGQGNAPDSTVINTPGGQVLCRTSSSGVVNCF